MTFMLNLEIDGKEAVKIEKKGVPQMRGTPFMLKISEIFISGTPCKESRA